MSERNVMSSLSHPYLVTLRFAFQTNHRLFLVMDYIEVRSNLLGYVIPCMVAFCLDKFCPDPRTLLLVDEYSLCGGYTPDWSLAQYVAV